MQPFSIQIDSVVDLLQLSRDPKGGGGSSYQVKCPFCGDSKYHMNINTVKNTYYCFSCGGSRTGGGALDLYGRVALGKELIPGKAEDGGNGSYLYAKLADALGMQRGVVHYARNNGNSQKDYGIRPASDENLNRAYSALLNIRELSLTNFHREKLMERGLDRVSIERNGYRSVLPYFDWGSVFWEDAAEYGRLGIYDAAMKYRQLRRQRKNILVGGYVVARILERQGISMEGVPGFFRLNDRWVFRLEPGMLIPTRNRDGLIVGLQTRKDDGDIRYMTVSSKDFPGGVTEKISRAHFPLANAPLTENSKILITEGPLKADVATFLLNEENVLMVAIPGVNLIKMLHQIFEDAKAAGVKAVYNYFDMDKVTNPNVAEASKKLRKMAKDYGLEVHTGVWDVSYAKIKWLELYGLCRSHGIYTPPMPDVPSDIVTAIGKMANKLHGRGIMHSHYFTRDGVVKRYWAEDTKGVDDYLLKEKKRGA